MTERKEAIMSYCVNCGVELDASATKCPLCDTPVYNPKAPEPSTQPSPFPKEKGQVEVVKMTLDADFYFLFYFGY